MSRWTGLVSTITRRRRVLATVLDQGLSTGSNAALLLSVSANESASGFGEFALAYAVMAFVLGLQRAGVGDPLLVAAKESGWIPPSAQIAFVRNLLLSAAAGASLLALTGAILEIPLGSVFDGELGSYLLWLAIVAPAVLIQDGLRFYAFGRARAESAALIDGVWLAVYVAGLLTLGDIRGVSAVMTWGLGATVSVVVAIVLLRPPWPSRAGQAPARRMVRMSFGLEFIAITAGGVVLLGGLRILLGPDAVAAIAAVVAVFQPANSVLAGLRLYYLPRLRSRIGTASYPREISGWAITIVVLLLGWLAMALLAQDLLRLLLGDTWDVARPVLFAGAAYELVQGLAALRADHLKVADRGRALVVGRVLFVGLFLLAAFTGAVVADVRGAATGRAVGAVIGLVIWLRLGTNGRPAADPRAPDHSQLPT